MNRTAIAVSLVPEARGGPFVLWGELDEACRLARAIGYDAIELFAPSAAAITAAGPVLRRHGLALAAAGTGAGWVLNKLSVSDPDALNRASAVRFIEQIIDAAAALGAPAILGSMTGRAAAGIARERSLDWLLRACTGFARRAAAAGVGFLIEPLNRYEGNLVNTLADGCALLDRIDGGRAGLLADCFHMNIEEADPAGALRAAGTHLAHVQLADSNRRVAGTGHTNWPAIATALRDLRYTGYLAVEALPLPDSETAARLGFDAIRRFFNASPGHACSTTV